MIVMQNKLLVRSQINNEIANHNERLANSGHSSNHSDRMTFSSNQAVFDGGVSRESNNYQSTRFSASRGSSVNLNSQF